MPGERAGHVARLVRDAGLQAGEGLGRGLHPDRLIGGRPEGLPRQEHGAHLVQGHVLEAAGGVAPHGLQQVRQQRGPQPAELGGDGVGQAHHPLGRALGLRGGSEQAVLRLGHERVRQHLGETAAGQHVRHAAALGLGAGQSAPGRSDGQGGGDAVEAVQAGDLLHVVLGHAQVVPPRRRGHAQHVPGVLDLRAEHLQELDDALARVVHADASRRVLRVQLDDDGRGPLADVGDARGRRSAGELDEELHGALGGLVGDLPVHAALVALGGLGGQAVAAPGAGDRHRVEVRGLDQHARGGLGDLGGGAAHDAGQPDRAGLVRDHEVLGVEGALLVVQGAQGLPRGGAAHRDPAGQAVRVVEVQRLAELPHHVVGDVHGQGVRTDAGQAQARGHPRRRGRGRVHALHHACHEPVAPVGPVDRGLVRERDGRAGVVRGGRGDAGGRVGERGAGGVGVLPGHAADAEPVRAVRGDVDLGSLLAQPEEVEHVRADLRVQAEVGEHDDALVVVAEAELAHRGHHAGRHVAVGLARGDPEVARQHGAGQAHDHLVPGLEVLRAAHDALHAGGLHALARERLLGALGHHADLAPVDGLAVLLRLGLLGQHLADDERAREPVRGTVHVLLFEADRHEVGEDVLGGGVGRDLRELAQPVKRDTHGKIRAPFRSAGRSGRRLRSCPACPGRRCGT